MSKEKNQCLISHHTIGELYGRKKNRWEDWPMFRWIKATVKWLSHCMVFRWIEWIFDAIDNLIFNGFSVNCNHSEQILETWQLDQASMVQKLLHTEKAGETLEATFSKALGQCYQTLAKQEGYSTYNDNDDFIHRKSIQYNGYPKTIKVSQLEQIVMDYTLAENMAEFFMAHPGEMTVQQEEQAFTASLNSIVLPLSPR